MKRYILTIILSLFCTYLFSIEFDNLRVHLGSLGRQRDIQSNSTETFDLSINNRGDAALHNLEISLTYTDDLIIVLSGQKVSALEPGETVRLTMEIINNHRYFFDRPALVIVTIANEDYASDFRFGFTIRAIENFWLGVILTLAALMIFLFIIVYIKADKGEKNAG